MLSRKKYCPSALHCPAGTGCVKHKLTQPGPQFVHDDLSTTFVHDVVHKLRKLSCKHVIASLVDIAGYVDKGCPQV